MSASCPNTSSSTSPATGDSSPVRVGNGAWDQSQLDVYGELLNAAWLLADQIGAFDGSPRASSSTPPRRAAQRWNEPDQGIWEIRGAPRHFVHSKLMCWVALDRAIRLAPRLPIEAPVERWRAVRDEIRAAIEEQGWSASASSFTQAFGSDELDASVLMLLHHRLPPAERSPDAGDGRRGRRRASATRRASCTATAATTGSAATKAPSPSARSGSCSASPTSATSTPARALFERLTAYANDVGLLAEEIDPATGELLGNFPQAFTHIGLVNAAWAIARAEGRAAKPDEPPVDRLVS